MIDLSSNPTQKKFIFAPQRYPAYYGGVGNGKTTAGIARAYLLSEGFPGNFGLIGRKTGPSLRDTTQKEFLDLVSARNGGTLEEGPVVKQFLKAENKLVFRNGSVVIFRYLEEMNKILSLNLGWFYVDQAEEVGQDVWETLIGRLRYWNPEKIRSWEADYSDYSLEYWKKRAVPHHTGFITGNPHPGWVFRLFKQKPPSEDYKLFEAGSDANRKNLPEGFVDDLRASYSEDYAQRFIDGKWDAFAGQVYKEFSETIHGVPSFPIPEHWKRIIALDHGYTNPTAVLWGAVDENGNLFIYREYYQAEKTVDYHANEIQLRCQDDPVDRFETRIVIWADPSTRGKQGITGRSIMEEYRMRGLALKPANNQVEAGILRTQDLMRLDPKHMNPLTHEKIAPKLYIFRNECPNLIDELKEYQWEPHKDGVEKNRSEKPRKHYDHACDALRYMVMTYYKETPKTPTDNKRVDNYTEYMRKFMREGIDSTEQLVHYGDY